MIIPKLHYISQGDSPKEHLENIQKACSSGAELVQLRLKDVSASPKGWSEKKILKIAKEARDITSHFQTRLYINDYYKIAKDVKADGVHLGKSDACPTLARKHLYTWQMIGGTANTLEDCETLISKEVDYISLGPFRYTTTKDSLPPILGLKGYSAIMDVLKGNTPIIGVGGITTKDVEAILETGISGVAVSGEITRDFNNIKTFHELLKASSTKEQRHTFK
ncbi:thiamine phosphate synthase [Xanthomarina sp. F1114]|uniref:thiamine phosphate synthase n=1 Tax=Xanthomarina sp. F1114 TaxID=2996019 RepID=UPI00225E66CD|nr:thiamine phosphate synthase [Xanthomarina sp. F1114]MCX7548119.1 thiamine phosphate synthase [Xanthomarina sp. F1114]